MTQTFGVSGDHQDTLTRVVWLEEIEGDVD